MPLAGFYSADVPLIETGEGRELDLSQAAVLANVSEAKAERCHPAKVWRQAHIAKIYHGHHIGPYPQPARSR